MKTFLLLYRLGLKQNRRSAVFGQKLATTIGLWFLGIYFLTVFIGASAGLYFVAKESADETNIMPYLCGVLLYVLLFDQIRRFFFMQLSVVAVQPYLHLPIKRDNILKYMLARSILGITNFIPLLLTGPIILLVLPKSNGILTAISYGILIISGTVVNTLLATLVKRNLAGNLYVTFGLLATFTGALALQTLGYISLFEISDWVFGPLVDIPGLVLIVPIAAFGLYRINLRQLQVAIYPMIEKANQKEAAKSGAFNMLQSKGTVGSLLWLEIQLILRHKRPRTALIMSLIMVAYGCIFFLNPQYSGKTFFLLFGSIFSTGIFMISYGQFVPSWNSTFFDGILTAQISLADYVKSRWLLLVISCGVWFVLCTPYAFLGFDIYKLILVSSLFNAGFSSLIILFAGSYNAKRIDLNKSAAFNFQGTGASQWLVSFPLLGAPMLILLPFWAFGATNMGIWAVGIVGLFFLALSPFLLGKLSEQYLEKKYVLAAGFRQSE